eukprot:TRINITY_DN2425_c0_g1_i1.p1 TRINITY_DN2425_c0_g1~~TRINITY_DN2425_c0_g1_i1.p1  ORF type:complete len:570 (-),score=221.14 TRINITY_DN2425_c0_g1_i1:98-1807(-)
MSQILFGLPTNISKVVGRSARCYATSKRQKLTPEQVQAAKEKQKTQKRTFLDNYVKKFPNRTKEMERFSQREAIKDEISQREADSQRQQKAQSHEADMAGFDSWAENIVEDFQETNGDKMQMEISKETAEEAWKLHKREPHYWNPIRLANLFDVEVQQMRGILWESKIVEEAREVGKITSIGYYSEIEDWMSDNVPYYVKRAENEIEDQIKKTKSPEILEMIAKLEAEGAVEVEAEEGEEGEAVEGEEEEGAELAEDEEAVAAEEGEEVVVADAAEDATDDDDDTTTTTVETTAEGLEGEFDLEKMIKELENDKGFIYTPSEEDLAILSKPPGLKKRVREDHLHVVFDDDIIREEMGEIFGTVDYPGTFEREPPAIVPIRKINNPWYYLPAGVKSQELIKFVRSRETTHYRESPRIPIRQTPPVRKVQERFASKMPVKPPVVGTPKAKWVMFDSSKCFDMYNRPIIVRHEDNTWSTPTWDERRQIHDRRRYIKRPYKLDFVKPDEDQPDNIAVANKPPSSYRVKYEFEDEIDINFMRSLKGERSVSKVIDRVSDVLVTKGTIHKMKGVN